MSEVDRAGAELADPENRTQIADPIAISIYLGRVGTPGPLSEASPDAVSVNVLLCWIEARAGMGWTHVGRYAQVSDPLSLGVGAPNRGGPESPLTAPSQIPLSSVEGDDDDKNLSVVQGNPQLVSPSGEAFRGQVEHILLTLWVVAEDVPLGCCRRR